MPRKPKAKPVDLLMIPAELLEQFGSGSTTDEAINAATPSPKTAMIDRALGGEMRLHLAAQRGQADHRDQPAQWHGRQDGPGRVRSDPVSRCRGPRWQLRTAADPKHERRFTGFDAKIVVMYDRAMTVRETQVFLQDQYGTEVLPDFISSVTDEVMAEVADPLVQVLPDGSIPDLRH